MARTSFFVAVSIACCSLFALVPSCNTQEPQPSTYYEQTIAPILQTSCVRTNTGAGCHVSDAKGYSLGNLDVSTFGNFNKRRDLLLDYGPYGQPAFLVKNIQSFQVTVQSYDAQSAKITTDIKHVGGTPLDPTASAYQTLRRYINEGATENNSGTPPAALQRQPCVTTVPVQTGFDPTTDPGAPDFATFRDRVNPVITSTCSAGNCHGTLANDLYFSCGNAPDQVRWNYFAASDYLAVTPEQSEFLRRPLAPAAGGSFHEGGVIFPTAADDGYKGFLEWAKEHGPPTVGTVDAGFDFFAHKVQPILVKKGCMMVQCHSAAMFHDYRLRGGSAGSFSLSATKRNYALSVSQMSFESDDPNASRLVRKNLYRAVSFDGSNGIAHRGGSLFEDFKDPTTNKTVLPTAAVCDTAMPAYDYDNGDINTIPAYCVVREWLRRERTVRNLAPLTSIVYVKRAIPAAPDRPQDFDVFAGGATLHIAKVTLTPTGDLTLGADAAVDLSGCGLDAQADIKRPSVSWDATTIAFAARANAGDTLHVFTMKADGTGCVKQPDIDAPFADAAGQPVHNFDPELSPPDDSGVSRIIFASTRGNLVSDPYDYKGPQHTPADPSKPNANLYALEPDPASPGQNHIRQVTFQLNMERYPSFMQDGRMIFTTEKRAPGFYQLALRRQNLDGTDYHPLFAQRSTVGYHQATHVVELANKNFAAIFSDQTAVHGGGTLGVFNRSLGIDFTSTVATDYAVDPTVIDPASADSVEDGAGGQPNFFLHSLSFPDGSASGHGGEPTDGVYTSPAALPNGKLLVSFGGATDAATFGGDYDLYVMDPETGAKTKLLGDAGVAEIEAVAIYPRAVKGLFSSPLDEPNGVVQLMPGHTEADINVLDFPVLAALLFQNTPTKHLIDNDLANFQVFEDMPPTPDVTTYAAGGSFVAMDTFGQVYVRRRLLGAVPVAQDGSAHFAIPGGVPIVLHLPDTALSRSMSLPRYQREEMTFIPGEYSHQSFKRNFFSGLCGQCHGTLTGRPTDGAVQPDILTQASATLNRGSTPTPLNIPVGQRGPIVGPPSTP